MNSRRTHKKNLIVSFKNLSEDLLLLFKEKYPEGYKDYLQRYDKPNGESIFVVPLETDDTVYMIKFEVKVDTTYDDDDLGKDFFDEEVEKADEEFAPLQEAIDKEENPNAHTERTVRHGAYEDMMDDENNRKKKPAAGSLSEIGEELAEAFSDDDFDDEFADDEPEDGKDEDEEDELEPSDEDLMEIDIDSDFFKDAEIPPEELARMAAEEKPVKGKRGRKPKAATAPAPATPAAPKKKGRPRKS